MFSILAQPTLRWTAICLISVALNSLAFSGQTTDEPKSTPETSGLGASDWPLERITLDDGKSYQGLVESESANGIEFVEVHRPRGKPMFLVVRPVSRKSIASLERLSQKEQQELRERLESHKHRVLVEARRMEDLVLSTSRHDGTVAWQYQGNWFSLDSTAAEAMTRRSIVRLEQIFTAYRQCFPPRRTGSGRLHIRVFGTSQLYHQALSELGLDIANPAVYLPDKNLILAGSDMNRFDAELSEVNRQHRQVRQQLDALVAETPARLKELNEDLKKSDMPAAERQKIVLAEQKKWDDQRKAARRKVAALDRKNAAKFHDVAGQMFTRLAHEAFHAYLETFVYPRQNYDVPRWLNEGLAQTFEAGLLEADSLRIETPNLSALARLQSDLRSDHPLELANLLTAGSDTFLNAHGQSGEAASRSYYYSWGLAYFLAFELNVLGKPALDEYLSPESAHQPAVERFERLVDMPLGEFEPMWREAMLKLKPAQ